MRMAEIASPASDPRSLRRHYPHQVQGVVQLDLSAIAAPPLLIFQTNTRSVNDKQIVAVRYGRPINVQSNRGSGVGTFRTAVGHQATIGLLPTLCWCGKWPSISHS